MEESKQTNMQGVLSVANALTETVEQEYEALVQLAAQFERQLETLRAQQLDALEQGTLDVHQTTAQLDRLRQTRTRQTRLLNRMLRLNASATLADMTDALDGLPEGAAAGASLRAVRDRVHTQAQTVRQRCEELEFMLQYAIGLGREMLEAMQDLNVPPPTRVYTATGSASQATTPRSFVNKLG